MILLRNVAFIAIICFACNSNVNTVAPLSAINLDSLADQQISYFIQNKFALDKKVIYNRQNEEHQVFVPNWKKELSFIKPFSIFKKEWQNEFERKELLHSNGRILVFQRKRNEIPVSIFAMQFDQNQRLIEIKATINEKNELYDHNEDVVLTFEEDQLTSYRLMGEQKIVGSQPITFEISATIIKSPND